MRWIVASALAFIIPMEAMQKKKEPTAEEQFFPKKVAEEADADLFKKDAQIYSVDLEFLYWTIAEGALDYALKMGHDAWGPSPSYAQGNFEIADYNLDPGFRACLRYFRAPHYWELEWQYTRLTSTGKDTSRKPVNGNKYTTGTWPHIFTNPLTKATSHLHLNYNVFEMLVSRVFFPNPHLRLRVIGGGLTAWMNQDWKVRYYDGFGNTTTIRNQWRFIGAGLKTGSIFDWYWTGELYMTGACSFSVLMGDYSNSAKQSTNFAPLAGDNTSVPIRDAFYTDARPTFSAQVLLGPSWQKNYPKNRIEAFIGFEMNMWFNLQEIYRSTAAVSSAAKETWLSTAAFCLYGITSRLTVDF